MSENTFNDPQRLPPALRSSVLERLMDDEEAPYQTLPRSRTEPEIILPMPEAIELPPPSPVVMRAVDVDRREQKHRSHLVWQRGELADIRNRLDSGDINHQTAHDLIMAIPDSPHREQE